MLEGLEVSVKSFSSVKENKDLRIEAEYHTAKGLTFKNYVLGLDILELEQYNSTYGLNDEGNGYPTLRMNEFDNIFTSKATMFFDKLSIEKFGELQLKKGDILICRTNGNPNLIGKSALVAKDYPYIYESHLFKVRVKEELIKASTTVVYLNTKYGRNEINKLSMQGNQANFSLAKFKELKFPNFNLGFNSKIDNIVFLAFSKSEQSKTLYTQAEQILLEELGFNNFPKVLELSGSCNSSIKTFKESYQTSSRLDAEYYQPKYDEILNAIRGFKNGFTNLKALIKEYSTGFPFNSESYVNNGFSLIRINNIKKGELDLSNANQIPAADINLSIKDVVKENDLLLSMSGTIGNCCKIPANTKAIINQRILRFSVQNFDADVLCLYINSVFGALQLERVGTGGVQTNISGGDIFNVEVPLIAEEIQIQIANLIQQSFHLRQQSKHLLEVAKQAVEIAIEQNETAALTFIHLNT